MVRLVNRAKMTTATTGTGTITLGSASGGFQTLAAAGVANGDTVRYVIEEGTAFEIGTGVFDATGGTLTRNPSESSIGGGAITLAGSALVFVTAASADIQQPPAEGPFVDGDKTKLDGIAAGAQVNVATNLGYTSAASAGTLTSSTGSNATLPAATTAVAGLLTSADKTKLDGIAAGAQVNVGTNLGSSGTGATRTITSSTGANTSIAYSAADVGAFPANNIPSGTKMLFAQTTAPTGWTKDTTHNNKALRVVSGTAGSGGSINFTTAFANRTVTNTAAGGTVAGRTLSVAQMPAHNHRVDHAAGPAGVFGIFSGTRFYNRVISTFVVNNQQPDRATSTVGSGGSHNHGFTGASHNHNLDMRVQYVDIIIATKA